MPLKFLENSKKTGKETNVNVENKNHSNSAFPCDNQCRNETKDDGDIENYGIFECYTILLKNL